MRDLVPRQTLAQFVQAHDQALALAREGLEKLGQAQEIFQAQAGPAYLLPDQLTSSDIETPSRRQEAIDEASIRLQEGFWQRILKVAGIRDMMGPEDRERMDKMFKEHTTPAFTVENLAATLQGLVDSRQEIFSSAVRSCFDRLRPGGHVGGYATNQLDRVGERAIITGAVSLSYSYWSWNYWYRRQDLVSDLDKVFHGMDGQGFPKYPHGAVTAIEEGFRNKVDHAETEYFAFCWFKIGTLHVRFKRLDLLAEFNLVGAGGRHEMGGQRATHR